MSARQGVLETSRAGAALIAFTGGACNLSLEIVGPRMLSSIYGSTTIVWASGISVTLIGLALGYYLGSRVPIHRTRSAMLYTLLAAGALTGATGWIIQWLADTFASYGGSAIMGTAGLSLFAPSVMYGMIPPLLVSARLGVAQSAAEQQASVGEIYASGSVGGVVGALVAAFALIPHAGLATTLGAIAATAFICAGAYARAWVPFALGYVALVAPRTSLAGHKDKLLLAQVDSEFQTIRVYDDRREGKRYMYLGPQCDSVFDLQLGVPGAPYARAIASSLAHMGRARVLIVGGAGNAIGRAFEADGCDVTTVEVDKKVAALSRMYFGGLVGTTVISDGRAFFRNMPQRRGFDIIVLDAFCGPGFIPHHMATQEFYSLVQDHLNQGGVVVQNTHGTLRGPGARAYSAIATTMASVFRNTRELPLLGETRGPDYLQNILLFASNNDAGIEHLKKVAQNGQTLTDDKNPIDMLALDAHYLGWHGHALWATE